MSGITGIFRRDDRDVDPADIKKMNDKISHRGPDGSRVWCEGPVAFGHQMLHTTQESLHEKLPFEDEESGLVITADARIDNRKDLAPLLGIEDNEYVSDSYFILKAYEKWGEKCPEELLGDFAFAIWDKNEETLFCARDHMGVKPFYYFISEHVFFFATEIKAILNILEFTSHLNEIKIATFLEEDFAKDEKFTFYKGIMRLIPAHAISIYEKDERIRRYWKLDPDFKIHFDTEEDYVEAFLEIFSEAILCRLRSAFPLGFDLSGGLDSSSVVCMAKNILENADPNFNNLKTFSYIFDDFPDIDERIYINEVIKTGKIDAYFIKADNISPLKEIETILHVLDQPHRNPFLPIMRESFEKMHENGIRTVLSGVGGDIVISTGRNYFYELAITFKWRKLIKEIKESSKITKSSLYKNWLNKVLLPLVFTLIPHSKEFTKKLLCIKNRNNCSKKYLNKYFEEKIRLNEKIKYFENYLSSSGTNTAREYHYFSIMDNLSSQDHFELLDLTCGTFSINYCHPYYDIRLIEFCYSIPTEMKMKSWNRYVQRVAMEGILPDKIQWRSNKASFHSFLLKNFYLFDEDILNEMMKDSEIIEDYLDFELVRDTYEKYKNNKITLYRDVYFLFISTVLYKWLKEMKNI